MGREKRERLRRILAGEEKPRSLKAKEEAIKAGVAVVQSYDTGGKVGFLGNALDEGKLTHKSVRKAIEDNAVKEMRKGIKKLAKKKIVPTPELLLEEYNNEKAFQKVAARVGLDKAWFVALAEAECRRSRNDR